MTQDKNSKGEPTAEKSKLVGVDVTVAPPRLAARSKSSVPPPLPRARSGPSVLIGPAQSSTGEPPVRDELPSEEISSSVLMPDESVLEQRREADVEELSPALLLEDPGEERPPRPGMSLAEARTSRPPPLPARAMRTSRPPAVHSNPPPNSTVASPTLTSSGTSPGRQAIEQRVQALRKRVRLLLAARGLRYRWFLLGIAAAGLAVGGGVVSLLAAPARRGARDDDTRRPAASASSVPVPAESVGPLASAAPPPPVASPANVVPCAIAGPPRVIAPSAIVAAGIEARPLGENIALGFAATENEAVAVRLEPTSLSSSMKVKAKSKDPIRRVTPTAESNGSLALTLDSESSDDAGHSWRTVSIAPPLQVGAAENALAWRRPGGDVGGKLWPLDSASGVEAVRGAAEDGGGLWTIALAFRRGNAIGVGLATGREEPTASGDVAYFDGMGGSIGSPAVALGRDVVFVAWADRPLQSDPWRMRWLHFRKGQRPPTPSAFSPPAGGNGGQVMSPGLTALPGRRFLFVWTEGAPAGHEVRAATVSEEGDVLGPAFNASNADTNAGQAQAAVTDAGLGVVAFLESTSTGFQVVAAPIVCGI